MQRWLHANGPVRRADQRASPVLAMIGAVTSPRTARPEPHGPAARQPQSHAHGHTPQPRSGRARLPASAQGHRRGADPLRRRRCVVGLVVLWPGGAPRHERTGVGFDRQTAARHGGRRWARSTARTSTPRRRRRPGTPRRRRGGRPPAQQTGQCEKATVEVTTRRATRAARSPRSSSPDATRQLTPGQGVVVAYAPDAPRDLQYAVTDVDRTFPMALLAGDLRPGGGRWSAGCAG